MDDPEWWKCAVYAYLDSEVYQDRAEELAARSDACASLSETVGSFLDGSLNFGTLKYRMDVASAENGHIFPSSSVGRVLSDLALGVPVDDLERDLRRSAALPPDPGEAKGALMDFEEAIERALSEGHLERSKARPERWTELMACLWHVQAPEDWPLVNLPAMRQLSERRLLDLGEPYHDFIQYVVVIRELAGTVGTGLEEVEGALMALDEHAVNVPDPDQCFQTNMESADQFAAQGRVDEALERYEQALALRPGTPRALAMKARLYTSKGLTMAAIAELEALIECQPDDRVAHADLIALYRSKNMVKEHNTEVRRWKALKAATK